MGAASAKWPRIREGTPSASQGVPPAAFCPKAKTSWIASRTNPEGIPNASPGFPTLGTPVPRRPTPKGLRIIAVVPQSLSAVYVHAVFSTKDRTPYLHDRDRCQEVHAYIGGVTRNLDCP